MDGLNNLTHAYKLLTMQLDQLTKQKEELKAQLLATVNHQEGTYDDIVVSRIQPEPIFDWKAFLDREKIKPKLAAKYYKNKDAYIRVTIKRSIQI